MAVMIEILAAAAAMMSPQTPAGAPVAPEPATYPVTVCAGGGQIARIISEPFPTDRLLAAGFFSADFSTATLADGGIPMLDAIAADKLAAFLATTPLAGVLRARKIDAEAIGCFSFRDAADAASFRRKLVAGLADLQEVVVQID